MNERSTMPLPTPDISSPCCYNLYMWQIIINVDLVSKKGCSEGGLAQRNITYHLFYHIYGHSTFGNICFLHEEVGKFFFLQSSP